MSAIGAMRVASWSTTDGPIGLYFVRAKIPPSYDPIITMAHMMSAPAITGTKSFQNFGFT